MIYSLGRRNILWSESQILFSLKTAMAMNFNHRQKKVHFCELKLMDPFLKVKRRFFPPPSLLSVGFLSLFKRHSLFISFHLMSFYTSLSTLASVPFLHVKVESVFHSLSTFHLTKSNLCHVKPKSNFFQRGKIHEKLSKIIRLCWVSTFVIRSFESLNDAELLSSSNVKTFPLF